MPGFRFSVLPYAVIPALLLLAAGCFGSAGKKKTPAPVLAQTRKPVTEPVALKTPEDEPVRVLNEDSAGCRWVEAKASVAFSETDTRHQAKALAVSRARSLAMEKFLGVDLKHQFIDFQQEGLKGEVGLTQSLLKATQHGRVLKETVLAHGPTDMPDCPGCLYAAHIRTCIIPMKSGADKGFRVELALNRSRFVEGDEAEIRVTPTREAYIYLYNVDMDWNAALMYPNDHFKENRVAAGETFVYPNPEMKKKAGARVEAQLPPDVEVSAELMRVIASKTPLPESVLSGKKGRRAAAGVEETHGGGTFLELMRRLSSSDIEWVDDNLAFTIYKR